MDYYSIVSLLFGVEKLALVVLCWVVVSRRIVPRHPQNKN
jgi:hypothetical protein